MDNHGMDVDGPEIQHGFKCGMACLNTSWYKAAILLMEEILINSWYGKYPIIYRVSYISGGAGVLPSTVSTGTGRMLSIGDMSLFDEETCVQALVNKLCHVAFPLS